MTIGVIAGNRSLPLTFCESAKKQDKNIKIIAICFYGETSPKISKYVDKALWLKVGQLNELIKIIKNENLKEMVMVGQISPFRIFKRTGWDQAMIELVSSIDDFRPHTIFSTIIKRLENEGVKFIDSTRFLSETLATDGVMVDAGLNIDTLSDIEFGTSLISKYVELDVGQTVVVKKKAAIALEGLEGTDKTILRGAKVAGKGTTVLKFSKKDQDLRFDVPIVGPKTLKLLKRIRSAALVLETERVIILEKSKFLDLAKKFKISVIGKKRTAP